MNYKLKKTAAFLLSFVMIIAMLPQRTAAAETEKEQYGYEIVVSPSPAVIGKEAVVTVRLTDYDEPKTGIMGFMIDITDSQDILKNAVHKTLVTDNDSVISNMTSYQTDNKGVKFVRHLYAKMMGSMAYDQKDLMELRIPIPDNFTEAGTLSFPYKFVISDADWNDRTYSSTLDISYVPAGEEPDVSVDLAWGAMDFTYTDGAWNPNTHTFADGSWTANGDSNQVTVTNSGTADVAVRFDYSSDRTDITGKFSDGENEISGAVTIPADTAKTCYLLLKGRPQDKIMENAVIGQVTVSLE